MRSSSFIARPLIVQVLTGIVLVLFCVTFLRFVSLTFAETPAPHTTTITTNNVDALFVFDRQVMEAEREMNRAIRRLAWSPRKHKRAWCGHDERHERLRAAQHQAHQAKLRLLRLQEQQRLTETVEHELKLRAAQPSEEDALLRSQLGLDQAPIIVMH